MNYIMKHRKHRCKRLRHELPWTSAMFYPNSLEFFCSGHESIVADQIYGYGTKNLPPLNGPDFFFCGEVAGLS